MPKDGPKRELTPEDDDWKPPRLDGRPREHSTSPLDTKPYQSELKPLDIPPYVNPPDHTAPIEGFGPGTGAGPHDQLTELTLAQEIDLLANNNVYLSTKQLDPKDARGLGVMAAYVVGGTLRPARNLAVRFGRLTLRPPSTGRHDSVSYSYNEFEFICRGQLVSENKFGAGIPLIFKVDLSYGYSSASATHEHEVSVYFSASQTIAKAHVVFEQKDITLEPSFVQSQKKSAILTSQRRPKPGTFCRISRTLGILFP